MQICSRYPFFFPSTSYILKVSFTYVIPQKSVFSFLNKILRDAKKEIKTRRGSIHAIDLEERVSWWKFSESIWRNIPCCILFFCQYSCWSVAVFVHFTNDWWLFHFWVKFMCRNKFCQENIESDFAWKVCFLILSLITDLDILIALPFSLSFLLVEYRILDQTLIWDQRNRTKLLFMRLHGI